MTEPPFFSIVSVARNDAWALVKTMRSVFEQGFRNFEYIVIDGDSTDHSQDLIAFWQGQGLVTAALSEPDTGVYNAMNKGLDRARGEFVCFMNAGDVFADSAVLERVHSVLLAGEHDGVLGWGELGNQIWASWTESEAFTMASLGFCHQALFLRRSRLVAAPFDERPFKTDSDTQQLGSLYAAGCRIPILPEVLAIRGAEPGISANLPRTALSITDTLTRSYPGLTDTTAAAILAFRRRCAGPETILSLVARADQRLARHLARLILDTLFQPQSASLDGLMLTRLMDAALAVLGQESQGAKEIEQLIMAQTRRATLLESGARARALLDRDISKFEAEEARRIDKHRATVASPATVRSPSGGGQAPVISLTSFPARIKTVSFAIQSLLEQTAPAAEIHLWLGRDEIPGHNWLPKRLRQLEDRGVTVHFAARTCHQYDKFLHNAALNAERPLIIVDDDVIYPPGALAALVDGHRQHPDAVIGNRCHLMMVDGDGRIGPYRDWIRESRCPEPSLRLFPTGAGGVLYPPGFLTDPMVTQVGDILAHAPYADDIWLKVCALARGCATFATALSHKADWYHRYTPTMAAGSLMSTNVERGLNDYQMARSLAWLGRVRPHWQADLAREALAA